MQNKSYYDYDVDFEAILIENALLDECFRLKDLKSRKLYLNSGIDMCSIEDIVKHIIRYNVEDRGIPVEDRQPIKLYITSPGGDVYAGFELIDVIENSKTPVYTINMGFQFSMGFLLGLSGHKRFATKHSKFLWHDGTSGTLNSTAKVRDEMEFQNRNEDRIRKFILEHSNIDPELYDSKLRVEWYMFAEEAKDLGVIDYIVGVDCDIDEII